jgi:hypothetical protein
MDDKIAKFNLITWLMTIYLLFMLFANNLLIIIIFPTPIDLINYQLIISIIRHIYFLLLLLI